MPIARSAAVAALAGTFLVAPVALADEPLPKPAEVKALAVHPDKVTLHSGDDTGTRADSLSCSSNGRGWDRRTVRSRPDSTRSSLRF